MDTTVSKPFPTLLVFSVLLGCFTTFAVSKLFTAWGETDRLRQEVGPLREEHDLAVAAASQRLPQVGRILEGCTYSTPSEGKDIETVRQILEAYGAQRRDIREMPDITVREDGPGPSLSFGAESIYFRHDSLTVANVHQTVLSIARWHLQWLALRDTHY